MGDFAALSKPRINTDTGTVRLPELQKPAGAGQKSATGIFGIDPALDGMSALGEMGRLEREALDNESASAARKAEWLARVDAFRKSLEGRYHTPSEFLLRESRDER